MENSLVCFNCRLIRGEELYDCTVCRRTSCEVCGIGKLCPKIGCRGGLSHNKTGEIFLREYYFTCVNQKCSRRHQVKSYDYHMATCRHRELPCPIAGCLEVREATAMAAHLMNPQKHGLVPTIVTLKDLHRFTYDVEEPWRGQMLAGIATRFMLKPQLIKLNINSKKVFVLLVQYIEQEMEAILLTLTKEPENYGVRFISKGEEVTLDESVKGRCLSTQMDLSVTSILSSKEVKAAATFKIRHEKVLENLKRNGRGGSSKFQLRIKITGPEEDVASDSEDDSPRTKGPRLEIPPINAPDITQEPFSRFPPIQPPTYTRLDLLKMERLKRFGDHKPPVPPVGGLEDRPRYSRRQ